MTTGAKVTLAFLGGAVAGAAALALLNRGKLDFEYLKPLANELLGKGTDLKDTLMAKVDAMKEELENLADEFRDKTEEERIQANLEKPSSDASV